MPDLPTLLKDSARTASRPLDAEALVRNARIRTRRRQAGVAAGVVAAVAAIGVTVASALPTPRPVQVYLDQPTETVRATVAPMPGVGKEAPSVDVGAPSQSSRQARRDGVPARVAALTLDERLAPLEHSHPGRQAVSTREGVWVVSRLNDPTEYAEVLLLNRSRTKILRAYPLRSYPPTYLLATPDAIYCGRQGDGVLPNSMLCRIDRASLGVRVRIFPHTDPYGAEPEDWLVGRYPDEPVFERLMITRHGLRASGYGGSVAVDEQTLEISDLRRRQN